MSEISFPPNPGHVVIGIDKDEMGPYVYAFHGPNAREMKTYPYDPESGNILWLVSHVADAALAAGADPISYSSTVHFWKEAIA